MNKYDFPKIKTELPGPKSKELIARDEKVSSKSYTRDWPVVFDHSEKCKIVDADGNEFLDFHAGIGVLNTGNVHPEIVKTIKEQAEKFTHIAGGDFYHTPMIDLMNKLTEIVPMSGHKRVFLTNSGAETVEAAMKISRYFTRRPYFLSFMGAFHGRTLGALSLTASKAVQKKFFAPLVPQSFHAPYPYPYRPMFSNNIDDCASDYIKYIEDELFTKLLPPEEVAAIFVEPIQGEGGYIVPPSRFHHELKKLCEKYGILYVADEIQSGMGRTGKMFAIEHWEGVEPDIILSAKALGSGLPLGAMIVKDEYMNWEPGAHASTFGGNPIACAAAYKTIELLEDGLIRNAAAMGKVLMNRLEDIKEQYSIVGDVRGKGLMTAAEIVKDKETKEIDKSLPSKIIEKAFNKGLMILPCGKNSIRFIPPLIIDEELIHRGMDIFEESVKETIREMR